MRPPASAPLGLAALALLVLSAGLAAAAGRAPETPPQAEIAWPEGFERWTWVKRGSSAPLVGKPAGTHHIYANPAAVEGYRAGRFPDGSVIVFDVLEIDAPHGPQTDPARRLRTDMMVRDSVRFAATGGWGYVRWIEPGRQPSAAVRADPATACHACHTARAGEDFVFTAPADLDGPQQP